MARVTESDVEAIMNQTFSDDFNADPFINTANVIVDSYITCSSATEAIKTEIEKYLSAHFISLVQNGGGIKTEKLGDASITYQTASTKTGMLNSTPFGQVATMLDPCAQLANLGNSPATIKAIYTAIEDWDYTALKDTVRTS